MGRRNLAFSAGEGALACCGGGVGEAFMTSMHLLFSNLSDEEKRPGEKARVSRYILNRWCILFGMSTILTPEEPDEAKKYWRTSMDQTHIGVKQPIANCLLVRSAPEKGEETLVYFLVYLPRIGNILSIVLLLHPAPCFPLSSRHQARAHL